MKSVARVGVLGGVRIPFARQNTHYTTAGNLDMLTAALKGVVERFGRLVLSLNRAKGTRARVALLARLRLSMLVPSVPNVNERRTGLPEMQRTCKQEVAKPAEFLKRTAAAKRRVWPRHRVLVSNLQLKRADAQANRRSCVLALRPRG
jgi:hypothetical protein